MTTIVQRQLVGSAELQHLLGVGRQRVSVLVASPQFPPPVAVLRMGQVWDLEDVRAWAEQTGRTVAELPDGWPHTAGEGESTRYRRT